VAEDGGHPSGTLRINGGEEAMRQLLRLVVPVFLGRYPQVSLDLVTDGRLVDIVEQGFDAGLRLAEAVPQDMIAVPLSEDFRFLAVAAPTYLAKAGQPLTPEDLRHHQCIRQRLPGAMTLNHTMLMIEAAADGLGIAYVPETAARPWLEAGRLIALLEDWSPPVGGLRLYYSSHRHVPAPLRAFINVMKGAG
jgi:DNA-binding transcriptional LysR family regulator